MVKFGPDSNPTTSPASSPTTIIPNTDGGGTPAYDPVEESLFSSEEALNLELRKLIFRLQSHGAL